MNEQYEGQKEFMLESVDAMLESFEYIEEVRAWGFNKGGKARMPKSKLADLYFAGARLYSQISIMGSDKQIKHLTEFVDSYRKYFN